MTIYIGTQELRAFTDQETGAIYKGDILVFGGASLSTVLGSEDGLDIFVSEDLQDTFIAE